MSETSESLQGLEKLCESDLEPQWRRSGRPTVLRPVPGASTRRSQDIPGEDSGDHGKGEILLPGHGRLRGLAQDVQSQDPNRGGIGSLSDTEANHMFFEGHDLADGLTLVAAGEVPQRRPGQDNDAQASSRSLEGLSQVGACHRQGALAQLPRG